MPDHLTTPDEMVAWMVGEMPELTAELTKGRITIAPALKYGCREYLRVGRPDSNRRCQLVEEAR